MKDIWSVSYGHCERTPYNFKEECYATARLIRDTINEPLTVLLSGGADSEVVLRSFSDQNIPVTATICQFNGNLNLHDISYAVICCEQLNVPYKLIPLNITSFLKTGKYLEYAEPVQLSRVGLCSSLWLAEQVDAVPIMGGNCQLIKTDCYPDLFPDSYETTSWQVWEYERFSSWYKYFSLPDKTRTTIPKFFQYTPEIILSFLQDEMIVDIVADKHKGLASTEYQKINFYMKHFPLFPRPKYSGYEKINHTKLMIEVSKDLMNRFSDSGVFQIEYHDLISVLEGRNQMNGQSVTESHIDKMKQTYYLNHSGLSHFVKHINE